MIKNILGCDFKYENDKLYRLHKTRKIWSCCNDRKPTNGYIIICINKKMYKLHRIIYKYFNPEWTIGDSSSYNQIDHININSLDNRIENLRVVNNSENQRNKNKYNSSSKYKGVCWHKPTNKWLASITTNVKKIHLGLFENEEEAAEAYNIANEEFMRISNPT